ncbi:hypothetical protein ACQBAU_09850 [Propionibacteriaceae bacterium Y2011]|uniref:hypothetical protein n=1 Tax=Microlunatus sp. Y2014 TaxID=3418488 RepID=UPI003B4D6FA8
MSKSLQEDEGTDEGAYLSSTVPATTSGDLTRTGELPPLPGEAAGRVKLRAG